MKDKDIYSWRYNDKELERLNYKVNAGTIYWCKSGIGIWDAKNKKLVDTYWSSGNAGFSKEDIKERLILKYIGNLNNLRPCDKSEFNHYNNKDCVNISHPNMSRSGFYIKKNAKKSLSKKRKVIKKHIEYYERKIKSYKQDVERLKEDLKNLTVDSYVPYNPDVYIG